MRTAQAPGADRVGPSPRVVTLTLNPALDDSFTVPRLVPTSKMRCSEPRFDPGGGGINAARVLHLLGVPVLAVFPCGGHLGDVLLDLLAAESLPTAPVRVPGETRQSHHVRDLATDTEYRFVLPGLPLAAADQERCLATVAAHGARAAYVVLSGSLPPGAPLGLVARVGELAADLGARLVVDAPGEVIGSVRGAYLLKPSIRELEHHSGRSLPTLDAQVTGAQALLADTGASVVLLSRGPDGLVVVTPEEAWPVASPATEVVSTIGAGDAVVGGMVAGLLRGWSLPRAGRFAAACSAAMVGTAGTAVFTRADLARFSDEAAPAGDERPADR